MATEFARDFPLSKWATTVGGSITTAGVVELRATENSDVFNAFYSVTFRYLEYLFKGHDGGPIRPQDYNIVYETLASTPYGISALINFLTNNLVRIFNEIPNGEIVAKNIFATLVPVAIREDEALKVRIRDARSAAALGPRVTMPFVF